MVKETAPGVSFGDALREAREGQQLSRFQISKKIGCHEKTIEHWEEHTHRPQTRLLRRIAKHYGISIETINQSLAEWEQAS
jgi:transcriptional regulator with XRE-family HTH domain